MASLPLRLTLLAGLAGSALCAAAPPLTGSWDATVQYGNYRVPFRFELAQTPAHNGTADISASFFNGDDRVTSTGGRLNGNQLSVNFDHYATRLNATVENGIIHGTYGSTRSGPHDFEAHPHREEPASTALAKAPDISGLWDLPTESAKGEHAWRLVIRQSGAKASAAILRVDGDTGSLEGVYRDGRFVLNHFDGARAAVLEITPQPDGTLKVDQPGLGKPDRHYVATRLEQAKAQGLPEPADPEGHTRVKHPDQPFTFSAPDLNGHLVSSTDDRFRNKVVILNITGSWCPNCHDEAPFLAELYRKYHSQGLEIVSLDFEESEQLHDPARLRAFIAKYHIGYTYLLAGEPSELAAKLPEAENLNSWPTTFFLGRDGTVRAIHAGFAGRASGPYHQELVKETTDRIEKLLAENTRASR